MSARTRSFMKQFHAVFEGTNLNLFPLLRDLYSYAHYLKHSQRRELA